MRNCYNKQKHLKQVLYELQLLVVPLGFLISFYLWPIRRQDFWKGCLLYALLVTSWRDSVAINTYMS